MKNFIKNVLAIVGVSAIASYIYNVGKDDGKTEEKINHAFDNESHDFVSDID